MDAPRLLFLGTGHGDPNLRRGNSGMLLRTQGKKYLIDCGDGTVTRLIRRGITPSELNAVFITHLHDDHTSGLISVIKGAGKYRWRFPDGRLQVFLPEPQAPAALENWLSVLRIPTAAQGTHITDYSPGPVFNDGILTLEARATNHFPPGKSNAFILSCGGKRFVITGDLNRSFQDFPIEAVNAAPTDAVICELTHYQLEYTAQILPRLQCRRLIFTHVFDPWDTPEGRRQLSEAIRVLPYPVSIAEDNTEVII